MVKLTEITEAQRIDKAIEVYALLLENPEMTQKDACDTVGITPAVYRYWIVQADDAIETFREAFVMVRRSELATIMIARERILQKLIKTALGPLASLDEILATYESIVRHSDYLSEQLQVKGGDRAREYLQGPEMEEAESRFAPGYDVGIMTDDEGGVNIKVSPKEIFDGDVVDITDKT